MIIIQVNASAYKVVIIQVNDLAYRVIIVQVSALAYKLVILQVCAVAYKLVIIQVTDLAYKFIITQISELVLHKMKVFRHSLRDLYPQRPRWCETLQLNLFCDDVLVDRRKIYPTCNSEVKGLL
jgi:hypothetical protein